jgi:DNA modification methylase
MDVYIWNKTNSSKKLMFGSYPSPPNFYAQNTTEFIGVFVKDGKPKVRSKSIKKKSVLKEWEWISFTKAVWDIPVPNKSDLAYGIHPAIMPEEIPYRLIKMYSFVFDIVLDPFFGSGTTGKVAKQLYRQWIGYEIDPTYSKIIGEKV